MKNTDQSPRKKIKTKKVFSLSLKGSEQGREGGWLHKSNHYPNSSTILKILVLKKNSLTNLQKPKHLLLGVIFLTI